MITDGLTPLAVLLFVGLVLGGGVAALLVLLALVGKRPGAARLVAALASGGVALYVVLLLVASLASRDRVLGPGAEKHICEVDCHLAYSVAGVTHQGTRYVVSVKVRFDETTISPARGMAPLTPNSRYVALVDDRGRRYPAPARDLARPLVPGESHTTDLVFDVAPDAGDLRLILASGDAVTLLLIGHENSFLHGKTTFRING